MKANETKVEDFLSSNKTQFVIPVYQRNYDWDTYQCKQLLDDILEVGINHNRNAHFIGSIVYVHDDIYTSSRIKELSIIDGQQRLTTLTLIYLAIYRFAIENGDEDRQIEILETYLTNKFSGQEEKLKLRPTENNDKAIKYLLRGDSREEFNHFSKVIENFNYFKSRITAENIEIVLKGLSKLMFVEISLDREKDDPQRIFESLNSTGLALSQADLIRNYILMGLSYDEQTEIYNNYWEIIENLAKDEKNNINKVSDFIRDYLTLVNNTIPTKNSVYLAFKSKYPNTNVKELKLHLYQIKSLAKYYNKLLNPQNESDKEIKLQLEYINKLEVNVAYPFLMKVYEDYSQNIINKQIFINILELTQSFVWRRFIVGVPTNALNKLFMSLYKEIDQNDYLFSLQKNLLTRTGAQRFPKDNEVKENLKVKDVYNIKPKNRTYLLERIENFENKESVIIEGNNEITIEHIFPQNPDPKWKIDLGEEQYNTIKENYLNTIANLTLSGNNGTLGNKDFITKRDMENAGYKDSRLWLNKYLSTAERWNLEELDNRFTILSERFLKIWQIPDIQIDSHNNDEVNIFDAEEPTHKKLEYAIFFNQKIQVNQVAKLYAEVFKKLFELQAELFFTTDLSEKIEIKKDPKELRQAIPINEIYFIEGNLDNINKFERIKYALQRFQAEEELTIKYAREEPND
ncbi:DUF262 domain-containing protein [Avibacterium paragallinarum]|uniref:DUF262 domain-containing protein n=3 Tax=Pasteurellaceae TaxID=712 RepID=A0AAE5TGW2_AVIPA|nr:DUF262 domain-containing protein [Avibacterium paragallinarum]MEE3609073.1 DUF262 domain-containing protein [Avibacterium paragallinarum]MEE3669094.1 DUF262 domain-containing protein [Avibacterium paragallinarum]MEE3680647.1 DUF262 domain-containing protein [Avibacterium paragallinarum]MEE4386249.1 DUF262 domain-containing protein [Avibacterium paragallinarum]PXZ38382.1 hypothetical protein DM482_09415 [Avibacterium paragallinarum]